MTSPTAPQSLSAERREEVLALWGKTGAVRYMDFSLSHIEPDFYDEFWRFVAAIDAQHAERTRVAVEAVKSEHERIMAECYQAVGMISESLGCQDDENYIRLLDMLAYGKTEDGKELLPFPVLPNLNARAEIEKMKETAILQIRAEAAATEDGETLESLHRVIERLRAVSIIDAHHAERVEKMREALEIATKAFHKIDDETIDHVAVGISRDALKAIRALSIEGTGQ